MSRLFWAVVSASIVCSVPAYAGTIRHDKSDSSYITLGQSYPGVGKLQWSDAGGSWLASGTLIRPNWVLTAGHTTDGVGQVGSFTINNTPYAVSDWIEHPNWNGDLNHGSDIGLVRLSSNVDGISPATLYSGGSELGLLGTSVGFGATGTGKTGYQSYTAGTKRAGTNRIDAFSSSIGMPNNDFWISDFDDPGNKDRKNSFGGSTPTDLEYSVAPGDSGGGTFIDVNGQAVLAGVNSFISAFRRPYGDGVTNASYSDIFGVTRVSLFNDWIEQTILQTDTALGATASFASSSGMLAGAETAMGPEVASAGAVQAVPEPASLAFLFAAAATVAICLLRRLGRAKLAHLTCGASRWPAARTSTCRRFR